MKRCVSADGELFDEPASSLGSWGSSARALGRGFRTARFYSVQGPRGVDESTTFISIGGTRADHTKRRRCRRCCPDP